MVFAALPPEVNSGLMYSGPGSGPLLTAAVAWDGLAAELYTAAAGYRAVVADLTAQTWHGPSATAMAAAVSPYLTWLSTTAARAEKIAGQAKWAAAAYESAFFMTVPPAAVAENRARLLSLVATNFLGQNTPAIAATEVHYGEMWAQDVAAMNGYAAAAQTAIDARSFDPPPQTTDPAGSLGQAAAVEQAVGSSAGTNTQTVSSQLTSALQGVLPAADGLPPTVPPVPPEPMGLLDLLAVVADEVGIGVALPLSIVSIFLGGAAWYYAELDSREIIESQDLLSGGQSTILDAIEELGTAWLSGGSPASAGLGQALSAGNLSVPPSWATAAPEIRTVAYTAPEPAATGLGGLGTAFGQMALAGMGGSALGGAVGRGRGNTARPAGAEQPGSAPRPADPVAPLEPPPRPPVVSVAAMAADLRELGGLRDSGLLTEAEFAEQKRRLLGR